MPAVEIRNVRKAYGGHTVIADASITIPSGSFTVLVGPSGCGKSTLLRMVAGLEDISGGTIRVGDRVVNDVPAKDRDVAMVFQNYALYPHMTVAQNMGFSLRLARRPKRDIEARVTEVARTLGVDRALKEYPDIELIARQPGNWNQIDSRRVMEDLIVAHPQIDGVFGQNDSVGVGAMQALEDAGLTGIPVVGLDGNAETMDLIKEGRFFATMSFTPSWQAGYSLVRAYDVAHGWKPSPCERMMYMGASLITADNVEAYTGFLAGDKFPFDWKKMSRTLHPDDWDPQNYVWPIDVANMWRTAEKPERVRGPLQGEDPRVRSGRPARDGRPPFLAAVPEVRDMHPLMTKAYLAAGAA